MPAILRIETIGRCVAQIGARRIDPSSERVFAALIYFGLERGRKHGRSTIADLFWPDTPATVQRARLRWLLTKLRGLGLGIDVGESQVGLSAGAVSFDFTELTDLPLDRVDTIMPGYAPAFSPAFAKWLAVQRGRIAATVLPQLLSRLSCAARVGDWEAISQIAEAVLRIEPLHEEAVLNLAEAQCRLGAKSRGLQTLEQYMVEIGDSRAELRVRAKLLEQRIRSIDSSGSRFEARFVGRVEQLRLIDGLLESARTGKGGALVLTGPAGIGKTRLLDEASLRASMAGMQVVRVKCQRGDRTRPLTGIIDLVPGLLELRGALGCDPAKLDRLRRLTQASGEATGALIGYTVSPEWQQAQLVDALLDLLDAASEEAPIVIQIDDVQWVERSLEWLWNSVVSWSAEHKVAWLFAFRTSHRSSVRLEVPQVAVAALEPNAAEEMLAELVANAPTSVDIDRPALLARGAGSPLFLRELVRHCVTTGSTDRLPTSLVSLLEMGLACLSKYALRTLQVAAVLGKYATLERIEAVSRLSRPDFLDAIAELELAGILSSDASGMTTGHVLWAEAALSRLTTNVARLLHRHAAQQFEEELRESTRLTLVWECARHWENAGDLERARKGMLTAAENLAQNGFPDDAVAAYSRAMSWTLDPHERLGLLDRRLVVLAAAGRSSEIEREVCAYDDLAAEIDPAYDGHSDHELRRWRACYLMTGDVRPLMEHSLACARSVRATTSHRLRSAKGCAVAAEFQSPAALREAFDIARSLNPVSAAEHWDRYLVEFVYHARCGDLRFARELASRQIALARARGDTPQLVYALGHNGRTCAVIGDFEHAMAAQLERISLAKQLGLFDDVRAGHDAVVAAYLDQDFLVDATKALEDLKSLTRVYGTRTRTAFHEVIIQLYASEIAVKTHRYDDVSIVQLGRDVIARQPPRCRARMLAILMATALAVGGEADAEAVAAELAPCFGESDVWLDWPAAVYGDYLARYRGAEEASRFADDFIHRVRRELYPPPASLAALAEGAAVKLRLVGVAK